MLKWTSPPGCHPPLRLWLAARGSLSARLQQVCEVFQVQRISQGRSALRTDESAGLGRPGRQRAHAREVVLRCDGEPVVYARSIVGPQAVRGPWRALLGLGSRPLAQLLFQDRGIRRSELAYARIPQVGPWRRHIARQWTRATGASCPRTGLWARRSVFEQHQAPLLLMEVFSPALVRRHPRPATPARKASRFRPRA